MGVNMKKELRLGLEVILNSMRYSEERTVLSDFKKTLSKFSASDVEHKTLTVLRNIYKQNKPEAVLIVRKMVWGLSRLQ